MTTYDNEDILKFWINKTTRFTAYHKKYIVSRLIDIPQHSYKNLSDHFLENVILLKTSRERKIFKRCIKILDFCNKYYNIYLCKQILGIYNSNYGLDVYKKFFSNSIKIYNKNNLTESEILKKLINSYV